MARMTLALLLLAACGSQVTLAPGQDGCTDYDFDNPSDSTVEFDVDGSGSGRVWRTNALLEQTGLTFDPTIEIAGGAVQVFEKWSGGETDEAFCYAPYVAFSGLSGKMTVQWFLEEGDEVPFDEVEVETE